jgi:hypothetical protein
MGELTSENFVQKRNSNRNCLYLLQTKTIYQRHCDFKRVLREQIQTQEESGFLCLQTSQEYRKGRPVQSNALYPSSFIVYLPALYQ